MALIKAAYLLLLLLGVKCSLGLAALEQSSNPITRFVMKNWYQGTSCS